MTLDIAPRPPRSRTIILADGPGPYTMSDAEAAYAVDQAKARALLRARPEPDAEVRRPRNTARDSLARLVEAGHITPSEQRAGREIATVSYITTLPARGRQTAGYAERTDGSTASGPDAWLDMEARFRAWHDWAKRTPATRRSAASVADATLLVCVDGWGAKEIMRRFGCRLETAIERIQTSLSVYCHRAGWSARASAVLRCADVA
jgi:hypothetical protein